jgi:hypothetical protein
VAQGTLTLTLSSLVADAIAKDPLEGLMTDKNAAGDGRRTDPAARYRERAEEVRAIAQCVKKEDTRRTLERVAADYDLMAKQSDAMVAERVPAFARSQRV